MSEKVDLFLDAFGVTTSNELRHYGVKGMKWGVRKRSELTSSDRKAIYKKLKKERRSETRSVVGNKNLLEQNIAYKKGVLRALKGQNPNKGIDLLTGPTFGLQKATRAAATAHVKDFLKENGIELD